MPELCVKSIIVDSDGFMATFPIKFLFFNLLRYYSLYHLKI